METNLINNTLLKKFAKKLIRMKTQAKRAYYHATIFEKKNNPKQLLNFINYVIHTNRSSTSLPFKLTLNRNETDEPGKFRNILRNTLYKLENKLPKRLN